MNLTEIIIAIITGIVTILTVGITYKKVNKNNKQNDITITGNNNKNVGRDDNSITM